MATEFDPALVSPSNPLGERQFVPDSMTNTNESYVPVVDGVVEILGRATAVIRSMKATRENSLAITKIEEAQLWLEKGARS